MAERQDDPREVLSLLNSLGFVGITAQQLKAFMKDLKIHRKIQERERQQWKEETKRKILHQQRELYREVLREHNAEIAARNALVESTTSSETSTFRDDSSCDVVTVKIRRVPGDKENREQRPKRAGPERKHSSETHTTWAEEFKRNASRYEDGGYLGGSSSSINESHKQADSLNAHTRSQSAGGSTDSTRYVTLAKPKRRVVASAKDSQPTSRSPRKLARSKSATTHRDVEQLHGREVPREPAEKPFEQSTEASTHPPPSRSSMQSRSKSFIRPWRLQPDAIKSAMNKKSDPVALYQKYQEEWKQLALPGEEQHSRLRWSVREKMLGLDPNPRAETFVETASNCCSQNSIFPSDCTGYKIYRRKSRRSTKRCEFEYSRVEKNLRSESRCISRNHVDSKYFEITTTKTHLQRMICVMLDKSIHSYTEKYKTMGMCSCSLKK